MAVFVGQRAVTVEISLPCQISFSIASTLTSYVSWEKVNRTSKTDDQTQRQIVTSSLTSSSSPSTDDLKVSWCFMKAWSSFSKLCVVASGAAVEASHFSNTRASRGNRGCLGASSSELNIPHKSQAMGMNFRIVKVSE